MQVKNKGSFKVVGIEMKTTVFECQKVLPALWKKFSSRLEEIKNKIGDTHYGVCFTISNKDCSFRYIACVEVSDFKDVPEGMVKETVPAGKYAVYAHKGKLSSIGDTYGFATSDIPNQGMKENGIWFEAYPEDWDPQSDGSVMEIWCGVK